jgi:hypothetical protein
VEAFHHTSVGRLVPVGNPALRPEVKVNDLVTSKISSTIKPKDEK